MSTEQQSTVPRGGLRLAAKGDDMPQEKAALPRQFVSFTFYQALPAWRMLDDKAKAAAKA